MIRTLYFAPGKAFRTDIPAPNFPKLLKDPHGLLWVDFSGESPEICQPILEGFGFHPLAIDDALQETHSPKVDDWDDYLYVVLNYMMVNPDDWKATNDELDIFVGRNYIVTHHDLSMDFVDEVWASCLRDTRHVQEGADHLLYLLADNLITHYMPIVEQVDEGLDEIEDKVFNGPSSATLQQLFTQEVAAVPVVKKALTTKSTQSRP